MVFFDIVKNGFMAFDGILNQLVVAVIIFVIGLLVGRIAGNFVKRMLSEFELNKIVRRAVNINARIDETIGNGVSYIIYFFSGIIALEKLGLANAVLNMIAGAVILLVVIALVLGIKDYIPNIIAGIIIFRNKTFRRGDFIEVADVNGEVIDIKLTETEIKSGSDSIFIPNSTILKSRLVKKN
jgi:small conductance mechanosensitive channel